LCQFGKIVLVYTYHVFSSVTCKLSGGKCKHSGKWH